MIQNRSWRFLGLGCVLVGATGLVTSAARGGDDDDTDFMSNQIIVSFEQEDGEGAPDISKVAGEYGATLLAEIPGTGLYLLELPETMTEEEFEDAFDNDEDQFGEAELNHITGVNEGQTQSFFAHVTGSEYPVQYATELIGVEAAQQSTQGEGILVAILDTGIDTSHEVLEEMIAAGGFNFVDQNTNVDDVGPGEMTGHGTYVAGIVALVAPQASILPLRVLDSDGLNNAFHLVEAIYYAIDQGADVINLSMGSHAHNEFVQQAIETARDAGVVVVAAAGNDGLEQLLYPAAYEGVIAVAATDENDLPAPFSNFGDAVTVAAPGVGIVSTVPGDNYGRWEGTSPATAFVSGAAALLLSIDQTPAEVEQTIIETAKPLNSQDLPDAGRLDIAAAVSSIQPDPVPGDLNQDGAVGVGDLLIVLSNWGVCPLEPPCAGDTNDDGVINVADLVTVLSNWG